MRRASRSRILRHSLGRHALSQAVLALPDLHSLDHRDSPIPGITTDSEPTGRVIPPLKGRESGITPIPCPWESLGITGITYPQPARTRPARALFGPLDHVSQL